MNICRDGCDGTRPDATSKELPVAPSAFVPTRGGVDMHDEDDDDSNYGNRCRISR